MDFGGTTIALDTMGQQWVPMVPRHWSNDPSLRSIKSLTLLILTVKAYKPVYTLALEFLSMAANIEEVEPFPLTTTDLAVSHWLNIVCPFLLVVRLLCLD